MMRVGATWGGAIFLTIVCLAVPTLSAMPDGGYLGVELEEENEGTDGARILNVEDGSPAGKAGIMAGFRVIRFNDHEIKHSMQLIELLGAASPGDVVKLSMMNPDGWAREFEVELVARKKEQTQKRAYLGVQLANADRGVRISSVRPGTAAEGAGLRVGDLILEANGKKSLTDQSFVDLIGELAPGSILRMQVEREGWMKTIEAELGSREESPSVPAGRAEEKPEPKPDEKRPAWLGVRLEPNDEGSGLVVLAVLPDGPAEKAGLKDGDVILRMAGHEITGFDTLGEILEGHSAGDVVGLVILRNGNRKETELTLGARNQ